MREKSSTGPYDPLTAKERSERMSRIRHADTKPEMIVRRLVYGMGYRYRLHDLTLPGSPDLVFKGKKKVIFVHGCFWHQHRCKTYKMPKTRVDFWTPKLKRNVERDRSTRSLLRKTGWDILIVWECELKKGDELKERIWSFLKVD